MIDTKIHDITAQQKLAIVLAELEAIAIAHTCYEQDGTSTAGIIANLSCEDGKITAAIGLAIAFVRERTGVKP